MQMNQIRYMEAAARLNSFSRAAEELYVTQPTLSQQIHRLEEEVGTPLFYRHSKSVSLTPAGSDFYEYAVRVLNDTDRITEQMKNYQNLQLGKIRLGAFWIFTYLDLADSLHEFNRDYPGIDLHLHLGSSNHLLAQLYRHELDACIAIVSSEIDHDPDYYYRLLHRDVMFLMVNHENPLSRRESLTLEDLEGQNVIMPASDTPLYDTLQKRLTSANVSFHEVCQSSHNEINAQMVSQNFAISFSSLAVAEKTNTGHFRIIPFLPKIERNVYFVAPKYQLEQPAIQKLINYFDEIE